MSVLELSEIESVDVHQEVGQVKELGWQIKGEIILMMKDELMINEKGDKGENIRK